MKRKYSFFFHQENFTQLPLHACFAFLIAFAMNFVSDSYGSLFCNVPNGTFDSYWMMMATSEALDGARTSMSKLYCGIECVTKQILSLESSVLMILVFMSLGSEQFVCRIYFVQYYVLISRHCSERLVTKFADSWFYVVSVATRSLWLSSFLYKQRTFSIICACWEHFEQCWSDAREQSCVHAF